jgi:hypothetical protein
VDEVVDLHYQHFQLLLVDVLMDESVQHQRMVVYQPLIQVESLIYTLFHHYQLDLLHERYKLLDHQDVKQEFVM